MQTQAFLKAVSSVDVFLLLAVPGFLFTKKKILTGRQVEGLSSVLVNFLWPAMVVDAMAQVQASRELIRQAGQAAVWALLVIAVGAVCAWIWLKVGKIGSVPGGILVFAAAFANTGLIGMPLIRLLLGEEMLFLSSIVELVNDVLIFTVGILLIQTGCGKPRQAALRGLLSPGHLLRPVHPAVRRRLGPGYPVRDAVHPVRGGDGAPVANGDYFVNKWEQFEKNMGIACKMKTDTL